MKKGNYKFDLKSGHYIILNEAEDTQAANQQNTNNNNASGVKQFPQRENKLLLLLL